MDNGFNQMNNFQDPGYAPENPQYVQTNVGQPGQPFMQQSGQPYVQQDPYLQQPYAQGGEPYMQQDPYMQQPYGQAGFAQNGYAQNGYAQNGYAQPAQPGFTVPTYAFQNGPSQYPQYNNPNGKRCTAMEIIGLVLGISALVLGLPSGILGLASVGAASSYNLSHRYNSYRYTSSAELEIIGVAIFFSVLTLACAITTIVLRAQVYRKADIITGKIKAGFGMAIPGLVLGAIAFLLSFISGLTTM